MTRRVAFVGATVAALAATIVLHSVSASPAPRRFILEIDKFEFRPQRLPLRPGDTVVWKNLDIVPHTATAIDGSWDTGTIEARGEWEGVVTQEMLIGYYCRFHPSMIARLIGHADSLQMATP